MPHTTSVAFSSHRFHPIVHAASARRRVLFCGLPAYGHLYPLLPLASAVRAAGHEVAFVTGSGFVPVLKRQGFPAYAAGVGPLEVAAEVFSGPVPRLPDGGPNRSAQARLFLDALPRRNTPDLVAAFRALRPDLVIYEQTAVGAAIAAAVAGVPAVAHGVVAGAATDTYDTSRWPGFGQVLAAFGLSSEADIRPDRILDPFPRSLRTGPVSRSVTTPIQPVPWRDPNGTTPPWLTESRRPVVYLTLGTVFGSADTLGLALRSLRGLGADVLVAAGSVDPTQLPPFPAGVHVERFVDQARILPLVDVVVHHGGSGTTLGTAASGLPQLILPTGADQKLNGDAVSAAGVGLMITPDRLDEAGVTSAVEAMLHEPAYAAAAQAVRREIAAMPAPDALVAGLVATPKAA